MLGWVWLGLLQTHLLAIQSWNLPPSVSHKPEQILLLFLTLSPLEMAKSADALVCSLFPQTSPLRHLLFPSSTAPTAAHSQVLWTCAGASTQARMPPPQPDKRSSPGHRSTSGSLDFSQG